MLKLTEKGQSSLEDLTEIRRVFQEVSRYEFLMGDEHYNAVQDAFFAAMRNFESELIEGIYDANVLVANKMPAGRGESWTETEMVFCGEKLRNVREARGVSQLIMARDLRIAQSLFSKYEKGSVKGLTYGRVIRIAQYLSVDPNCFYIPGKTSEENKGEEDANNLEVWRCEPIGKQGSAAGEVH
jgi:transcriptional regulator with XRE-family HTH domain